ncbi:MAG: agmatinase family protein [Bacteroidetes bacterium]|nr:agmatinase family protein [Bacteroidota bacterium]HET6245156.1 agmatinase family protein [Bacteroidia bacterium]
MDTKEKKISTFDSSGMSTIESLFGLPFTTEEAEIIVIPVPWEVTVSYTAGTSNGPQAIMKASSQVDLFDPYLKNAWKIGIAMIDFPQEIKDKSDFLRIKASHYIENLTDGTLTEEDPTSLIITKEINDACYEMNNWVKQKSLEYLNKNKLVVLLGGDHSTPLGLMQAMAEKYSRFGLLQIDAHADLRIAYEGFKYSHASIIYNALDIKEIEKVVQVGIRDYSESEALIIQNSKGRIHTFFDRDIKQMQYEGQSWKSICNLIVEQLPQNVYLTFDIDGLDPKLCPNTGTPVAGGFEFEQILYLIEQVVESKRKIIGFDLNEVTPGEDEWDANVGARLLFRIANMMAKSMGKS